MLDDIPRDSRGLFQKGSPPGPGRPKGARNKLSEALLEALDADFKEHGKNAITEMRQKDPAAYVRALVSLVPKEMHLTTTSSPFSELSDDDLAELIAFYRARVGSPGSGREGNARQGGPGEPDQLH